jgi:hypothetical protein
MTDVSALASVSGQLLPVRQSKMAAVDRGNIEAVLGFQEPVDFPAGSIQKVGEFSRGAPEKSNHGVT